MKKINDHPLAFLFLFFAIYLLLFFHLESLQREPMLILHSSLDDLIPFSRFAVLPYCLWFPEIAFTLAYFLFKCNRKEFWRMAAPLCFGMMSTLIFYCFVATEITLRPQDPTENDIFAFAVKMVHMADNPTNVCPSIHVLVCVIFNHAWIRYAKQNEKAWIAIASMLLNIAIIASTLFLKQHSIIDVIAGLAYAYVIEAAAHSVFQMKRA